MKKLRKPAAAIGMASLCSLAQADGTASGISDAQLRNEILIAAPLLQKPAATRPPFTDDAASLLEDQPGVSLYTGGGISSLPAIHGLNDDRVKILVDGMQITSACANHMNPALSYVAPATVAKIGAIAGLTPVSMGGDSIAGTISVSSAPPAFASAGILERGSLSASHRSVSGGSSISVQASIAGTSTALDYSGSTDRAGSYSDGKGRKVLDTLYQATNHRLRLASKGEKNLLVLSAGVQSVPYQGFANQRMDMVGNHGNTLDADYRKDFSWGNLDARLYWQDTQHAMGFFTPEKPGTMPMNTHGKDLGYALKAELPLSQRHTLRIGNEFHSFRLDDWWPAVSGSAMMSPNAYVNINNGKRDVFSLYAETETEWSAIWESMFGIRAERVNSDAGNVQGYGCGMMCAADASAAAAFNAASHARRDDNFDLTLLARYAPERTENYEFGYSRKTRSPNLYERYAWGRSQMAMSMVGWFGDANGYVGNLSLKPEVAHTLSAKANWHDAGGKTWEISAAPYYSYIQDYIDANRIGTYVSGGSTFSNLQFANHNARVYGIDFTGMAKVWENAYGLGRIRGVASWLKGNRLDNGAGLYHIMPFNMLLSLENSKGPWTHALEIRLVDRKSSVDLQRNEPATPGYALLNLSAAYETERFRLDFSVDNLFDKFYTLPLGGVDYAGWKANGSAGRIAALAGPGRSVNLGATVRF